jgi:hypothetical protein
MQVVVQLFGVVFPVVFFILLPLFALNLINRLLVCLKMEKYQFGTAIPTDEQLREGKRQLEKFKKLVMRGEERAALKNHILNLTKNEDVDESGGIWAMLIGRTAGKSRSLIMHDRAELHGSKCQ